jgi:hypothetical protein
MNGEKHIGSDGGPEDGKCPLCGLPGNSGWWSNDDCVLDIEGSTAAVTADIHCNRFSDASALIEINGQAAPGAQFAIWKTTSLASVQAFVQMNHIACFCPLWEELGTTTLFAMARSHWRKGKTKRAPDALLRRGLGLDDTSLRVLYDNGTDRVALGKYSDGSYVLCLSATS